MKQTLRITTKQSLRMTPQLQQAIKLLQLSSLELEAEVKAALESNPMLEGTENDPSNTDLPVDTQWDNVNQDIEWHHIQPSYENYETAENYDSAPITLSDHLLWQLNLTPFTSRDRAIAVTIIDAIDESGYLRSSLEDLSTTLQNNDPAEFQDLESDELDSVLHRVQQFDPIGVASRNLQECMSLQLNILPNTTPLLQECKELVAQLLEELAAKKYSFIKQQLHLNEPQLQSVIHTLTRLHPYPGALINTTASDYIVPDVIIKKSNNRWTVELNHDLSHKVRVNANYASLIKRADNSRDNQFLRDQLTEAKWFLNGIKSRNETLLKVASCIVKQQQGFLEKGEEFMRPLKLIDVALAVDLNESTVSRITTKKYMHTPRGIFELKYFFSSSLSNSEGSCSSTAIKAIIKKLISKESAQAPLSDQGLSSLLIEQGIKVSRRTVAKYRESLGLLSSNQRKK